MAGSNAVWGIDIGQCALKALQCRPHKKDPNQIVVDSFDYIEYPKILSQPEADPEELIREALQQFLERNDLTGDRVAISVAGQSGLARFIKLPPVESFSPMRHRKNPSVERLSPLDLASCWTVVSVVSCRSTLVTKSFTASTAEPRSKSKARTSRSCVSRTSLPKSFKKLGSDLSKFQISIQN